MSEIHSVEVVDETEHKVKIGSGARWSEVARVLGEKGLALSSGDTKSVGVGGLTLGGGIGWLVRKVGLTIDSLLSAEIVTATGEVLQVSATNHPDLFWAIRGGGGNFGIVTNFEFTAYPLRSVVAGPISYSIDEVKNVLRGWRDRMREAPDELNSTALVMPSFGGKPPAVLILICYAGEDEEKAFEIVRPFQALGKVQFQAVTSKPYEKVLEDAFPPSGVDITTKVQFVQNFSDEFIDIIAQQCSTSIPILQIRYLGGEMNRVGSDSTAFAHRNSEVLVVSPFFTQQGSSLETVTNALEPWSKFSVFGKGTYANLLSTNTLEDIESMYPVTTYSRLAKIKKTYDPENVFNQNYNVKPE